MPHILGPVLCGKKTYYFVHEDQVQALPSSLARRQDWGNWEKQTTSKGLHRRAAPCLLRWQEVVLESPES